MTGVQVYMVRVDHEDRLIAAVDGMDAMQSDFRRFLAEELREGDWTETEATRDEIQGDYNQLFEQIVHVGEIELFTARALAQLEEGDS